MLGNYSCFCCRLLTFSTTTKHQTQEHYKSVKTLANSLDPDQDRQSVGPDLEPNYLQMFSANDKLKSLLASEELKELKMGLLTHLNIMEFPTIIKWTSPFSF